MYKAAVLLAVVGIACGQSRTPSASASLSKPAKSTTPDFTCPDEFGYFPHPDDCSLYYVCVFGGALLESCTGGLMYSHELQTCDWPRNVQCGFQTKQVTGPSDLQTQTQQQQQLEQPSPSQQPQQIFVRPTENLTVPSTGSSSGFEEEQILLDPQSYQYQQIRQRQPQQQQPETNNYIRVTSAPVHQQTQYVDNSDLLRNTPQQINGISVTPSSNPKFLTNIRFQDDNQADGARQGRSYEQNQPNYKEELYTVGSDQQQNNMTSELHSHNRVKRHAYLRGDYNGFYGPNPGQDNMYPSSYWRQRDLNLDITRQQQHPQHQQQQQQHAFQIAQHQQEQQQKQQQHHQHQYRMHLQKHRPTTSSNHHQLRQPQSTSSSSYPQRPTAESSDWDLERQPHQHYSNQAYANGGVGGGGAAALPVRSLQSTSTTTTSTKNPYSTHRLKPISDRQRAKEHHRIYNEQSKGLRSNHHKIHDAMLHHEYLLDQQQRRYRQNQHESSIRDTGAEEEVDAEVFNPEEPKEEERNVMARYPPSLFKYPESHRLSLPKTSALPTTLRNPFSSPNPTPTKVAETDDGQEELPEGFMPSTRWTSLPTTDPTQATTLGSKEIFEYEDEEDLGSLVDEDIGSGERDSGAKTQNIHFKNNHKGEEQPSRFTIDEQSVSGNGKPHQQEIIVDPEYLNQRYAANIQPVIQPQPQPQPQQIQVVSTAAAPTANSSLYYDDAYYVYEDEKEPHYDDVDYKSNVAEPQREREVVTYKTTTTTTTTTRRPLPPPTPKPTRAPSRGSVRHKPGSGHNRPTLKPSSSIVKDVQDSIRDVYVDAPSRPQNVYETPEPNTPASKCRRDSCVLPDCYCGGKNIPGDLPASSVPQIVLLTFDDSVNDLNKDLYRDLFEKGRKNPNGCPISATFYVSHEWTDYSQVQNLAADGHEIASHSVSHSFGEQFSQKKWDKEIGGQREILAAYGGVKLSEVRGMRAPFLAIGGNNMFKMLHDSNFTYDSSMPVYENRPPSWPYTLDYRIHHDCMIPPCPTKSYPGVWEVPMVMWQDLKGGRCSMGDACSNPPTAEGVYNMLAKNFERHYTTNRAPFGLYYHAAWFTQPHHKEGFEAFLDTLVNMDDVWLVTNWQALQWVRDPTPINQILNFEPWSCHNKDRPRRCNNPRVCNLWHKSGVRYMKTCQQCPPQYPWVGSTGVSSPNAL